VKQFHGFRLDTTNHCLWRGNERVALTPKAFDLLRYLVDHAERVVTQEEILEALWTDTFVNQEVVKKYILGIRKVLGDRRGDAEFIRTFPKRGYQFVAPITDDRPPSMGRPAAASRSLVDRPTALDRLETILERSTRGERQVVFVNGEAGVGKTTFVNQFLRRAGLMPNLRIARGQCIDGFGEQEAYYPILEVIDQLIRASDDGRFVHTLAKRAPTWLLQFPSLLKTEQREALQRETVGATRGRMVREICETLEAITVDATLILVLEDLHWADLSTLDIVSTFARRQGPARLLIVGTHRPPVEASQTALTRLRQDLAIHDLSGEIVLEPFDAAEVSEYVSLEFGQASFANDLGSSIHRHAGGNPLFVAAIVTDLVTSGVVTHDYDGWRLTASVDRIEPRVPASLQDMLNVQFDQLTEIERRTLKKASAIGERFPAVAVAEVATDIDNVESTCERLAERRLFIRTAGMGELADGTLSAYYEFHHSLYRQAIYRRLSELSRSKLHRQIGERLETLFSPPTLALSSEIALHFEKAHDYERAIQYFMHAAAYAARRFAVRDSVDVLQHALSLVPRLPSDRRAPLEIQILERIGDAHYVLGGMVESALAYETESALAARAGLTAAQVQAQSCLARPLGLLDPDRAITVLQEAAKASVKLNDPVAQARVDVLAAGTRLLYDTWRADDGRICDAAHRIAHPAGERHIPGFDGVLYAHVQSLQGECIAALEIAEAGVPHLNETTGVMVHLFALSAQILALLQLGRFGRVLHIIRESEEMAARNGSDPWLFQYRDAWLRTLATDFAGAQRVCHLLMRSSVYPTGQAKAIGQLAAGFEALDQGRHDQALRCFEEVRDPTRTPKFFLHWYWRMHAHVGLTRAWLQSRQMANARMEACRLTEAALSTADPNLQALAWETSAQVATAETNWREARQSIDNALAALSRLDVPTFAWRVHGTAWDLYRKMGQTETAAAHRARARMHIAALANSFERDEPLRQIFLGAASVRRIHEEALEMEL
jgi:DNA-binding winged helix-turn-helix (wHTH) protein/tetratricopeptide (TPR) repeat protein